MIEVLRSNDVVRLDYAMMILRQAGCHPVLADRFMASTEGGISALQRRILVPDEYQAEAKELLKHLDDLPAEPDGGKDIEGEYDPEANP